MKKTIIIMAVIVLALISLVSAPNEIVKPQTINPSFTKPAYTDLSLKRVGDKLNITFSGEYATIRGYFYYEGNTYTFAQASSYGVTYDSWVNYNTGTSSKFGGMINTSNVPQIVKDNGYFVVFELVDKSEGLNYRKEGDSIYLNDNVKIIWKDYENPNNKFNVYNETTVYLTDNGSKFHNTLIYDPQVEVANFSIGIFNNTYYNSTKKLVAVNLSSSNGTYSSQIFSLNGSFDRINITTNTSSWSGYEVNGTIREYNFSTLRNISDNLVLFVPFDDANNETLNHYDNMSGDFIETSNAWWGIQDTDCKEERCFRAYNKSMDTRIVYPTTQTIQEFTLIWFITSYKNESVYPITFSISAPADVKLESRYDDTNKIICVFNRTTNANYGTYVQNIPMMVGCIFNGTHTTVIADGTVQPTGTFINNSLGLIFNRMHIGNDIFSIRFSNSTIDNVMLFNRVLTSDEVLELNGSYPRWQPHKEEQTFASGVDTKNYSINDITKFVQAKFKMRANVTDSTLLYDFNITAYNITVITVADSCSCPSSGDWVIINNDQCTLSSICNIGTNKLRVNNGALRIESSGYLRAGGCFVNDSQRLYINDNGGLYCGG